MTIITLPYVPRDYQLDFEEAMENGVKRALLVWHRRAGKDVACWNFLIREALQTKNCGVYYYLLPTQRHARKVIWDGIDESGKRFLDFIPKELIDGKPNQMEMRIRLVSGSIIQLIGTDNYDSITGTNPRGCVFSEYALQDHKAWELVISPILLKNKGWAIFNSTPRGKNHLYELYDMAKDNPEWFVQKLTVDDTGLITKEELDKERKEGRSEELIQQEYYTSFERGVEGTYYGRLIDDARRDGRICSVPYDPAITVDTYWDLGFGDSTAIIFLQRVGQELHIIDYYEEHGKGIRDYIRDLKEKPYLYGRHYAPHDVEASNLSTGRSLRLYAKDLGLDYQVISRTDIEYGIERVRATLPRCWVDEVKCKKLIRCLENYRKKFNEKMNVYSNIPLHDWSSHGADAMRYLSLGVQHYNAKGMSAEDIKKMRDKHFGTGN